MSDEVPEYLRRLRESAGRPVETPKAFDDDLIPDLSDSVKPPTPEVDPALQSAMDQIDVLDAYRRWCGKMEPNVGSKRENIMISCPIPGHTDNDPSAAVNLDKGEGGVWDCYTCNVGGDKYTIAAFRFGIPVDANNKINPADFPKLRRAMAEDMGVIIKRSIGGQEYAVVPDNGSDSSPTETEPEPEPIEKSNVIALPTALDLSLDAEIEEHNIRIEWEDIIPRDTFLWEWMTATTIDDLPHEYYFWLGMQAIAFAAGNDALLSDFQLIKPNLFVCLFGRTGSGKSRALGPYVDLLEQALPYDEDPYEVPTGTSILASPASAEALLKMFSRELLDNATNQPIDLVQVRGLLRIEEFASFIARASRSSNPMKETLIELYDVLGRNMKHKSISGGVVMAKEPFCQMVTTTQPAAIHDFLRRTDAHSGFLNRWVFAAGKRRRDRISYGGVQTNIATPILHLKNMHHAFKAAPTVYHLAGDALVEWDTFFQKEIVPLHDFTDESMLSRIDLTLKKIILLFTLNEGEAQPTADIVRRAIKVYQYLRQTYMVFSKDISFNEQEDCRVQILKIIERRGKDGASLRDITRGLGGKFPSQTIATTLKLMIDLDELEEHISQNKKGPKTKRYTRAG